MDEDGADELADGGNAVPWWENQSAIDSFDPDMQHQLRRIQEREAAIAGLVGTLTPVEQEVLNRKYGLGNIVEPQSAADIAATMKRKEIAHPTGRNWSHEAIKPVHDAAIKRLKGKNNIDEFREFLRALTDHLDMIKSQGAVKIVGPGLLLRRIAGRQVLTACGDLAKSLSLDNSKGMLVHTSRGKNFIIAKGNEMKEIDDLLKSTGIAEEVLKSHVKEYTRTTASGATVQVKEHDDNRVVHHKLDARGNVDSTQKHIDDVHTGGREDGFHHHDLIEHDGPEGKGMFRSGNHIVHGDKDAVAAAWRASRNHEKKHGPKGNAYNYPSSWHKAVTEAAQKKTGKDVKVEHVNVNDYSQMKRLTRS
jgi:hypothetical protein